MAPPHSPTRPDTLVYFLRPFNLRGAPTMAPPHSPTRRNHSFTFPQALHPAGATDNGPGPTPPLGRTLVYLLQAPFRRTLVFRVSFGCLSLGLAVSWPLSRQVAHLGADPLARGPGVRARPSVEVGDRVRDREEENLYSGDAPRLGHGRDRCSRRRRVTMGRGGDGRSSLETGFPSRAHMPDGGTTLSRRCRRRRRSTACLASFEDLLVGRQPPELCLRHNPRVGGARTSVLRIGPRSYAGVGPSWNFVFPPPADALGP